jgi:hypothetical protein
LLRHTDAEGPGRGAEQRNTWTASRIFSACSMKPPTRARISATSLLKTCQTFYSG